MIRSTILIFCVAIFSLTLSAQDDTRTLKKFSEVHVSGGIAVEMKEGSPKADITIKKGDLEDLIVEVKGERLKIYFKDKSFWRGGGDRSAIVKLSYSGNIKDIHVSAGASLDGLDELSATNFSLHTSSGARANVMVDADEMDVHVSSGGSAKVEGETDYLDVHASSGGSFAGKNLKAEEVDAHASSGGSAKIWVTDSLAAEASSGGSVKYKGEPKKTNIDVGKWSGGSVSKM